MDNKNSEANFNNKSEHEKIVHKNGPNKWVEIHEFSAEKQQTNGEHILPHVTFSF
jgi:hypothetical protein